MVLRKIPAQLNLRSDRLNTLLMRPLAKPGRLRQRYQKLLIAVTWVAIAVALQRLVAQPSHIQTDTLHPTLRVGDRVLAERVSYFWHRPQRGDLILFDTPDQAQRHRLVNDSTLLQRVIGLPGETIMVRNGAVYINEHLLVEPYLEEFADYTWGPYQVPQKHVFVLGDNRNQSQDSHIWGFLSIRHIRGKVWFRIWPWQRWG
ncbi:MAG: signal peptidase I [Cyanobacteria bacterium P01_H01_bin.121]